VTPTFGSATYLCETHGPVVGYIPFQYLEPTGFMHSIGPFCPLCVNEWFARTFTTLKPIEGPSGGGSA